MDKKILFASSIAGIVVASALTYSIMREEVKNIPVVAETQSGKVVKYVGPVCVNPENRETVFGESLVCNVVHPEGICHLVFEAKDDGKGNPIVPGIQLWLSPGVKPFQIVDSKTTEGNLIWSALFKGNGCLAMAESDYYIGSAMEQIINSGKRKRFLKANPLKNAKDKDGKPLGMVSFDHPSADKDQEVFFPHGWMGGEGLNFRKVRQSELE